MYFPSEHAIIEIKMAAVSVKRSMGHEANLMRDLCSVFTERIKT